MTPEDALSRLARPTTGTRTGSTPCPDEQVLASYVDGALSGADRTAFEAHLADCAGCLSLVGLLAHPDDHDSVEPVPEHVLARVRRLPVRRRSFRDIVPLATAAAAALVAFTVSQQFAQPLQGDGEEMYREVRSAGAATAPLRVLSPADGARIRAEELLVRWTEVPGTDRYEVRIVSDTGDLVTEQRVARPEWRPGPDLGLEPGQEYFVRVDAFPADARPISSDHVPFVVMERP